MTISRYLYGIFFMMVLGVLVSCSGKKADETHDADHHHDSDTTAAAEEADWKAMDDFHMVMAETFHPFKDSANLAPIKARAAELATAAETWANEPLPEKVDNEEMKTKLQALKVEAAALVETVKTNNEKAIGEGLTRLHGSFHAIQEMWYGGKGGHHHH